MVIAFKGIVTAMMILQLACVLWFHMAEIKRDGSNRAAEIGFSFMEIADAASLFAIWIGR